MALLDVVVGVVLVAVFVLVPLFLLFRMRGDVLRIWTSKSVLYFRKHRPNRPFRVKIRRGIARAMTDKYVEQIDRCILQQTEKGEFVKKDNQFVQADDIPDTLFKFWNEARKHPQDFTIWSTFFKRRWRLPDGQTGSWVYMFHLVPHEEMMLKLGRHRITRGVLLRNPMRVHLPPTKEEWFEMHRKDITDPKRQKAIEKEYKRISKEKWLNIFYHPTVTVTGEHEIFERLVGFENVTAINAFAFSKLGGELAKLEAYTHFAKGREDYERQLIGMMHDTADRLGTQTQTVQQLHRTVQEKTTPLTISTEGAPYPIGFSPKPVEAPKPSRFKTPLPENFWTYITLFVGFFMIVIGLALYAQNPSAWAILLFGVALFIFGVWDWRKGRGVRLPQIVKEKSEEAKESFKEEGAG